MSLQARTRLTFQGEEAEYVTYNLLPHAARTAVDELLRTEAPGRMLLLSGAAEEDQKYLLDSAAYVACRRGSTVRVAQVRLAGFEPEGQTATEYVQQLLHDRAIRDEEAREALWREAEDTVRQVQDRLGLPLAVGLTLTVSPGPNAIRLLRNLLRTDDPRPGPELRASDVLHYLLRELTKESQLIVFLPGLETLPQPLLEDLARIARLNGRLVLAFGCVDADRARVGLWDEPVTTRLALSPLDADTIRQGLEERFPGNELDAGFRHRLLRSSGGSAWLAAALLQWLATREVLTRPEGGAWRVDLIRWETEEDEKRMMDALLPVVSQDLHRVDALQAGGDPAGMALRELILRGALCGPVLPVRLVAETVAAARSGVTPDALVEALDTRFGDEADEPRDALFQSWDYAHPGFPGGVLAYAFRDEITRVALRGMVTPDQRRRWAGELLAHVDAAFPVRTRGAAALMLQLARETGDDRVVERWEQALAWWVVEEDAAAVRSIAARALEKGTLHFDTLWAVAFRTETPLPPPVVVALLDALEEHGIPIHLQCTFYRDRGALWLGVANHASALEDLRHALNTCPRNDARVLAAIHLRLSAAHLGLDRPHGSPAPRPGSPAAGSTGIRSGRPVPPAVSQHDGRGVASPWRAQRGGAPADGVPVRRAAAGARRDRAARRPAAHRHAHVGVGRRAPGREDRVAGGGRGAGSAAPWRARPARRCGGHRTGVRARGGRKAPRGPGSGGARAGPLQKCAGEPGPEHAAGHGRARPRRSGQGGPFPRACAARGGSGGHAGGDGQ